MDFDFLNFFDACDPSRTLVLANPEDRQYYIDFAAVRGGKVVEAIERTIQLKTRKDQPTCQLFTGHIGCGKSTELRRLQADLEQSGFHVVYFEASEYLDMADVDITDILLAIIRQVTESLESAKIFIKPTAFKRIFDDLADFLQSPVELAYENEFSLPIGLGKITAQTKESPKLRSRLRQYLEPRTSSILDVLNQEVIEVANEKLIEGGKQGLVVIVDNLDRVDNRPTASNRTQPEYLFVDRGDQLRQLNCHVVYTIPLMLMFSNEYQALTNRFGGGVAPKMLPMVPVQNRDSSDHPQGLNLLKQMVLARAFPELHPGQRLERISEIFDDPSTLDRLCRVSGGHVRNLLGILYRCLQEDDPPITRSCLERAIRENRETLALGITDEEWELLAQVIVKQQIRGEVEHQTLMRSLFVFEYHDDEGRWFDINPALRETKKFASLNLIAS